MLMDITHDSLKFLRTLDPRQFRQVVTALFRLLQIQNRMTRRRSLASHFVASILANTASYTMWTVRCSACRWSASGTTTTSTDDCGVSPGRRVHGGDTRVALGDAVTHAARIGFRYWGGHRLPPPLSRR